MIQMKHKFPARPALVPALLVAALAAACSTPMQQPAAMTPMSAAPAAASTVATVTPTPAAPARATTAPAPRAPLDVPAHLDPDSPLNAARSVYFGFDEYVVTPSQLPVLERHGRYLGDNPSLTVRVEGHTDERGGSEYNLALGQKRAEAVRQALQLQGVQLPRIEAVSFGKERPRATGSNEEAWAQNRRADVVYPQQR
jgi:peptidoglycan-associated lipoprotein